MSEEWRTGSGYHWKSNESSGYAVDNLDTKQLADLGEGSDIFERLFVLTRDAIDLYKGLDRKIEGDHLDICHHISRYLSQNRKKIQ
jgi:hypothetical protein